MCKQLDYWRIEGQWRKVEKNWILPVFKKNGTVEHADIRLAHLTALVRPSVSE